MTTVAFRKPLPSADLTCPETDTPAADGVRFPSVQSENAVMPFADTVFAAAFSVNGATAVETAPVNRYNK